MQISICSAVEELETDPLPLSKARRGSGGVQTHPGSSGEFSVRTAAPQLELGAGTSLTVRRPG